MSRHDIVLLSCIIFLAFILLLGQGLFIGQSESRDLTVHLTAPIYSELDEMSLTNLEAAGQEVSWNLKSNEGSLVVNFKPGKGLAITQSSCPDQICVKTGYINKAGQATVCVPNQVVLEIQLNDKLGKGDVDAILK